MSRTDKDRPYWVRSNDNLENRQPHHSCGRWWWRRDRIDPTRCTIDEPLTEHRWFWTAPCAWILVTNNRWSTHVPPEMIRGRWNGPERSRIREHSRDVVKMARAGEDLDDWDFPNYQHRHCAQWDWD